MLQGWFNLMAAGAETTRVAMRTAETAAAAGRVVRARSVILSEAVKDPVAADYAELGMLIPEKLAAAGQAAGDVMAESLRIWIDMGRAWGSMAHAGGPGFGNPAELAARTMDLYGIALDPFHRAVTRNDRRLHRKRR